MSASETIEIERKFLAARMPPDFDPLTGIFIEQGYMAVSDDGTEIRLRRKGDRFYQTVKKGRGLVRTEVEIELNADQFAILLPMTGERRVSKYRYTLPLAGHTCELDVFCEPLTGLVMVEVEFSSIEESRRFSPPDWFAEEVTEVEGFKNKMLALHGIPSGYLEDKPTEC